MEKVDLERASDHIRAFNLAGERIDALVRAAGGCERVRVCTRGGYPDQWLQDVLSSPQNADPGQFDMINHAADIESRRYHGVNGTALFALQNVLWGVARDVAREQIARDALARAASAELARVLRARCGIAYSQGADWIDGEATTQELNRELCRSCLILDLQQTMWKSQQNMSTSVDVAHIPVDVLPPVRTTTRARSQRIDLANVHEVVAVMKRLVAATQMLAAKEGDCITLES